MKIKNIELDILKGLKKKAMEIEDNRIKRKCTYKLWNVVVLTVCTWDALNTQKSNIEAVIKNGGDYVVPIKGNHKNFKKDIADYFDEDICNIIKSGYEGSYLCEREKSHNKIITYEYYQIEKIEWFEECKEWRGLKSFTYVSKKMEDLVIRKKFIDF